MKRYIGISLTCLCALLVSATAFAAPQHNEFTIIDPIVDIVGDVNGTKPIISKAAQDTTWIMTWDFEGCSEAGWVKEDHRLLNNGEIYWQVNADFNNIANISGNAAVLTNHDICWDIQDGYGNDWIQGICIRYVGDSFLSFDVLLDTESCCDFLDVRTDSACASFDRVDFVNAPRFTAQDYRDLVWSAGGFDTTTARIDSLALSGYTTGDTHCVYIEFADDGAFSQEDGLQQTVLKAAAVVDNIDLIGAFPRSEDFSSFSETVDISFRNMQDDTPLGLWQRIFLHITDNDVCSENPSCAWLETDDTTPSSFADPSMNFAPGGFVVHLWYDNTVVSPWVSLSGTPDAVGTILQFRRFPGNFFSTGRGVQNWSTRSRTRVSNTDTPGLGDSIDCATPWSHAFQYNSLSLFAWITSTWNATGNIKPEARDIQVRLRGATWVWIAGATDPTPFNPGPGPFWDRVRFGRQEVFGPVIDQGIDGRYQAQDAAPNDPANEAGPLYAQAAGGDIFGTTAFSRSTDLGINESTTRLIVGDSITVNVFDVLQTGGANTEVWGCIVSGPHAGKAPPGLSINSAGFFEVTADSSRDTNGALVPDRYFVDLDDTYFRGGDAMRYLWIATDLAGGVSSLPSGLTTEPASLEDAEAATGGIFEVNYLPTVEWDPNYVAALQAGAEDFDRAPTADELANSSQKNCILYYENINSRRRSGDVNRTSFQYTLDQLGYRGSYDTYDHMGAGNTNNHLGSRMSPEQARGYSLLVYDAGNRGPGFILPDGIDIDAEKINMSQWFIDYLGLSGAGNPNHTLWIMGSNVVEEKPTQTLYNNTMGVLLGSTDQAEDANPEVFGASNFTNGASCAQTHVNDQYSLAGGCPIIRNYDELQDTGGSTKTHVYGKTSPSNKGAIIMNNNPGVGTNATTILQSHPWFDIRDSQNVQPSSPEPEEALLTTILTCALAAGCEENIDPVDRDDLTAPPVSQLLQNKPNPFNPTTEIRFDLARAGHVSLKIYDVAGREIRTLVNEKLAAERHRVTWNGLDNAGSRVSSGVYFYRVVSGSFSATKKMVVMK